MTFLINVEKLDNFIIKIIKTICFTINFNLQYNKVSIYLLSNIFNIKIDNVFLSILIFTIKCLFSDYLDFKNLNNLQC